MISLSIIILSNTLDNDIYIINCECINSLFASEPWDSEQLSVSVIIIESNKQANYIYNERVNVLTSEEPFNFNQFLNIGIQSTDSEFIALCNNDIIFHKGWFTEILKVKSNKPDILCFSPIDRDYSTMSMDKFPDSSDYYLGWENKFHFSAWCFVVDRNIFSIIGPLDERFNFYSADDDFLMTLRKYSLDNALVTKSHVKHLSQQVTQKIDEKESPKITDREQYPIPLKDLNRGLEWLWDDIRFYEAYFKMKAKWGDSRMIGRINRLLDKFPFLRKRIITQILYSKSANILLSKLTGI